MKKVAILTFSNTTNYGAVLQCYALKKKLNELGFKADVLNYHCNAVTEREKIFIFSNKIKSLIKSILLIYPQIIRKIKFKFFCQKQEIYTKKIYTPENLSTSNSEYDIFVVGSDQVWNLQLNGYDYHYFLDFVNEKKTKIAYAASLGNDNIDFNEYNKITKYLKEFDKISLREKTSISVLNKLNLTGIAILDPIFLLSKSEWQKEIQAEKHSKINQKKYILLYFIHNGDKTFNIAKKIAKKYNYQIIYLNNYGIYRKGMKNIFSTDPFNFINLIENAELVITGSFHGIAFSINLNKNFYYEKAASKNNNNTRIDNLIELFKLNDRNIINLEREEEIKEMNYEPVNKIIKKHREEAEKYIKSWDKNVEN